MKVRSHRDIRMEEVIWDLLHKHLFVLSIKREAADPDSPTVQLMDLIGLILTEYYKIHGQRIEEEFVPLWVARTAPLPGRLSPQAFAPEGTDTARSARTYRAAKRYVANAELVRRVPSRRSKATGHGSTKKAR